MEPLLPLAFEIRRHGSLGSTNDELRRLATEGAPHGTVVQAREQTAGRGRMGRTWSSPAGNLYLSVLLRGVPLRRMAELGFVAALAVADTVDRLLPAGPIAALKWPNDVLVGGAKIAGILVEGLDGETAILGIGLNVDHAPTGLPYAATCLLAHAGAPVELETALQHLLDALAARWRAWESQGFAYVRAAWLGRGPPPGAELRLALGAEIVTGAFAGLDGDGALLLRDAGGTRRFVAGDVAQS